MSSLVSASARGQTHGVTEPGDEPSPAELASRITAADKPSKPDPGGLRFQWNVPRGVKPDVPLGLTLLMLGIVAFVVLLNLLQR